MVQGRIVVNAVMVGTLHEAIVSMQRLGIFIEAVHIQVSRSAGIAGGVMFKPNPVYIIVGVRDARRRGASRETRTPDSAGGQAPSEAKAVFVPANWPTTWYGRTGPMRSSLNSL